MYADVTLLLRSRQSTNRVMAAGFLTAGLNTGFQTQALTRITNIISNQVLQEL